ncbi:hypothetical protein [Paracoccus chinensis]|uniref:Uncharacterized protein n=1 Tax=Paracoccus chinensis TaxID=525640 RepID=A0A1G9LKM0_9RHOB|nr:hypothetical protein [Paracoccus chinensis]SDL62035.1 hypothetical protein SAMN04487971_11518 [Paracoccus chinensis]
MVVYERLQAHSAAEMGRLAQALSLELEGWQPGTPRISRQRDETNAAFRSRCMQDWLTAAAE